MKKFLALCVLIAVVPFLMAAYDPRVWSRVNGVLSPGAGTDDFAVGRGACAGGVDCFFVDVSSSTISCNSFDDIEGCGFVTEAPQNEGESYTLCEAKTNGTDCAILQVSTALATDVVINIDDNGIGATRSIAGAVAPTLTADDLVAGRSACDGGTDCITLEALTGNIVCNSPDGIAGCGFQGVAPAATGATITLPEATDNGTDKIILKAEDALAQDVTLLFNDTGGITGYRQAVLLWDSDVDAAWTNDESEVEIGYFVPVTGDPRLADFSKIRIEFEGFQPTTATGTFLYMIDEEGEIVGDDGGEDNYEFFLRRENAQPPPFEGDYSNTYTSSALWTVTHNKGTVNVLWAAYDSNDEAIVPDTVTVVNANTVTMAFSPNAAGYAVISGGNDGGQAAWEAMHTQLSGIGYIDLEVQSGGVVDAFKAISGWVEIQLPHLDVDQRHRISWKVMLGEASGAFIGMSGSSGEAVYQLSALPGGAGNLAAGIKLQTNSVGSDPYDLTSARARVWGIK
jgi:hypothetical protein